jgi:SAM-dependent methyltransferase
MWCEEEIVTVSETGAEVLRFYRRLPFNYYGDADLAAAAVRRRNSLLNYPVIVPLLKQGVKTLDVGCGAGWLVNSVNFHYGAHGTTAAGVDFNAEAILQARAVASRLGTRTDFVETNLFEYRPRARYDLVTSLGVLHHTGDCLGGLRHLLRHCVRPGGHAFIGLYHRYGRRPFLDHFRDLKSRGWGEPELIEEFASLRAGHGDRLQDLSWFYDQVAHPHETQHTLEEVLPVLRDEDMTLVSSSINRFEPFTTDEELVARERDYEAMAVRRIQERRYFPGFFVFLARKADGSDTMVKGDGR